MIGGSDLGKDIPCGGAEPPPGSVASYCRPYFATHRDAQPQVGVGVGMFVCRVAGARLNYKASVGGFFPFRGDAQEFGSPLQASDEAFHVYAEMRLRPLARRRASTLRPATVDMRARKPWRRLRILTLGWKVRFTVHSPLPGTLPARAVYRVAVAPVNPWA